MGQNGGTLFDRPKPTTGCSANGRRRRMYLDFVTKTMKYSFTLKKERGLRMFENMVLRRIFEPRTDEVTGMEKTT
jgi:hypothetical protein